MQKQKKYNKDIDRKRSICYNYDVLNKEVDTSTNHNERNNDYDYRNHDDP